MTESTQLQAANNNNGSTVKMEPLPSIVTSSAVNTTTSTETLSTTNISIMEQHQRQQQQLRTSLVEAQTHPHHQYQQQQYALKWNDYQTSILTSFRHLRDEEDFVDVTLACNHRSFTAHKVVLSACSPYFRKLLKANPCEHPIVILRDVPADDIENLLSFMYNGEVNVGHDHLSDFLKIAHLLQIRGLADVKNNNDNENHNAYTAVFNNGHSNAVKSLSNALINHNTNNNNNNKETTNDNINNKGDTNGSNNNNNNNNGFLASTSCNNSNINKLNFLTAATQALNNNSSSTFPTPTPLAAIAAAAASVCVSSNIMPNNNAVSNFSTNSNSHSNSSESNNKNDSNVNHSNCSNNKNIINTHSNNLNDNIGNNSINRTNDHTSNINDNTEHNNNSNSSTNNNSNSNNHSNINNNISNNNNNNNDISSSNCGKSLTLSTTPAIQELKASAASPVRKTIQNKTNHWDINESSDRNSHLTPPPQKRIKSADLFRAQHGISPERLLIDREFSIRGQHPLTRTRSRETSRDRERERDIHESLLGQALENTNGLQKLHSDISALQAQSAGEDSDGSDTEPSDRGDGQHEGTLDSLDNQRTHAFPNAFLGLQGIPGLLPGPSNMTPNDFVVDVQKNFDKYLSAQIKEEIKAEVEESTDCKETNDSKILPANIGITTTATNTTMKVKRNEREDKMRFGQLTHSETEINVDNEQQYTMIGRLYKTTLRNRSTNSSPARSVRSCWHDNDYDNIIEDDPSSSLSSAISLTMKTSRHDNESTLYQTLMKKQQQQQEQNLLNEQQDNSFHRNRHEQQQQQEQQHQQQQQQQYLDELQQTAVTHQQQLTANLLMARTIAFSRSHDFPELFQNPSAAAVAAAAAAAATATAATANAAAAAANSGNYMLPCPLCETPLEQRVFRQHLDRHYPRDSPVCPVIECGRRFAHPNSVRNHMRIKHTLQWAKMKAMRSSGGPFAGGPDFK